MTTMFIDTNGEMSFVDNERLKFIMHYLKQGADDSLVEMKDGRFVREDSELSFTEIWLPAAEHQQRKIDEQQAKVEEQAQEIANLKSLIQGHELRHRQNLSIKQKLTRRSEVLQKRVDALTLALDQIAYPIPHMQKEAELNGCELNGYWAVKMSEDHTYSKDIARRALEKEQALKGEG